ncbi:MAG TPA: BTAD domain-containing putative transcriptional regulator [Actinomycetales bacterium]|nr:BTAD domain-containing putative transcriptional regulator [Actinomycetales bacterium]
MNAHASPDAPQGTAEVRVLGTLRARRTDGTMVEPRDWRTGQTADLLRMLALHVDEPVPVDVLLEALWPSVDERRGRASLRSAASRIRTALGEGCVVRRLGGLVLTNAWVDAHAFTALAREARRHVVTGALAQAVTTTREAESLYLDDFRAHHDSADWAVAERATLSATYRQLLADAADAAVSLSWWYDAVDLAERSLAAEPLSERAYRALMRGYRGLGEASRALQVYERCRRTLADEVGADPSPSTQALHLELLSEEPVESPPPPFCGRDHERSWLRQATERAAASGRPEVVLVHGPAGAGVSRLLDETWPAGTASALRLSVTTSRDVCVDLRASLPEQVRRGGPGSAEPVVAVVDDAGALDAAGVARLADELLGLRGPVSVVVAGRTSSGGFPQLLERALAPTLGPRLNVLPLAPLAEEEIAQLCSGVLQGQVSEPLTEAVVAETGGIPGRALDLVCGWASTGRVAATSAGLVVLQAGRADLGTTVHQELASAVDRLSAAELEVLQLVGVIGRAAPRDLLLPLVVLEGEVPTEADRQELQRALDRLTDLTLLTSSDEGYAPRDPLLNDALLTWMRPSSLRRLHRRVAEQAHIHASERVEHWLEAAEPQLAMAAALDATDEAIAAGRFDVARRHLRQLCLAPATAEAAPSDRLELFERLGDVCLELGRTHEAHEAYGTALSAARAGDPSDLPRLEAKLASTGDSVAAAAQEAADRAVGIDDARGQWTRGAGPAGERPGLAAPHAVPALDPATDAAEPAVGRVGRPAVHPGLEHRPGPAGDRPAPAAVREDPVVPVPTTVRRGTPPDPEVAARLQDDVRAADELGDAHRQAAARAVLVRTICVPRRQFREARQRTQEGLAVASSPSRRAELLVADAFPGAVLGNARVAEDVLGTASELAVDGTSAEAVADLRALRALIAHDLGRPDVDGLVAEAEAAGAFSPDGEHCWVLVRSATERDDLDAAERADELPVPQDAGPVARQLRECASAALAMARGRRDEARRRLLSVIDVANETGTTLMVPEAAARLVILEAPDDGASARRRFELFEWAAGGESWLPRETVLRLLARAAIRAADGRPDDAASAAAAAADAAESTGLVYAAVAAHRARATHLTAAGRPSEARLAMAAATRWHELAKQGVPATRVDGSDGAAPVGQRARVPRQDRPREARERRDDPHEQSRRGG